VIFLGCCTALLDAAPPQETFPFSDLPDLIQREIFQNYLTAEDRKSCRRVNKEWKDKIDGPILCSLKNKNKSLKPTELMMGAKLSMKDTIRESQLVAYIEAFPERFWDIMDKLNGELGNTRFFLEIQDPELHQKLNIAAINGFCQKAVPQWTASIDPHFFEAFSENQEKQIGSIGFYEALSYFLSTAAYDLRKIRALDPREWFPVGQNGKFIRFFYKGS
jgi:uncharacterized protein Usg